MRLTNTSDKPCGTGGFGGVSLVSSPRSEPVGAPADRVERNAVKPLVLQPGRRAEATLRISNADNVAKATCRPTPTKGLRVYPPNETRAAYVPFRGDGLCRSHGAPARAAALRGGVRDALLGSTRT